MQLHSPFCRWVGWLLGQILVGYKKEGSSQADQISCQLVEKDRCWVGLWPEGTVGLIEYVSTGFYYMARKAKVPIILLVPHYGRRKIYASEALDVSKMTVEEVFQWVRDRLDEFDAKNSGKNAEKASPFHAKPSHLMKVVDPETDQYVFVPRKVMEKVDKKKD
jgi:hypothetical protein